MTTRDEAHGEQLRLFPENTWRRCDAGGNLTRDAGIYRDQTTLPEIALLARAHADGRLDPEWTPEFTGRVCRMLEARLATWQETSSAMDAGVRLMVLEAVRLLRPISPAAGDSTAPQPTE